MAFYHDLDRLDTTITGWHVRVKVLRIFRVAFHPKSPESLGLILVDEKGEKVEAFIDKAHTKYYLDFIEEDRWYTIIKFSFFLNNGSTKVTKSLFKIGFLGDTIMRDFDPVNECIYVSITPFCTLLNGTVDRSYLVELVGYVFKAGKLSNVDVYPIELGGYRLSFILKGKEGHYIKCMAEGQASINFNNGYTDTASFNDTVVCVLRWWKVYQPSIGPQHVRVYSEKLISKVLFNPDVPEVLDMLNIALETVGDSADHSMN